MTLWSASFALAGFPSPSFCRFCGHIDLSCQLDLFRFSRGMMVMMQVAIRRANKLANNYGKSDSLFSQDSRGKQRNEQLFRLLWPASSRWQSIKALLNGNFLLEPFPEWQLWKGIPFCSPVCPSAPCHHPRTMAVVHLSPLIGQIKRLCRVWLVDCRHWRANHGLAFL